MVSAVNAVVIPLQGGHWPADWPAALEPLRAASRTIQVATGSQETIYEIPINDRETFDRVWVAVRTLATPGGQLTLYHTEPARLAGWGNILSNAGTTIRIYAPSGGCFSKGGLGLATEADIKQAVEQGAALRAEPPWPKSIIGPGGELPQFVTFDTDSAGHAIWISAEEPIDASRLRGFLCRARIDLDLIVDGTTVDLNQIQLPKNVRVIDRLFSGEK
jgi:hypothetical protein